MSEEAIREARLEKLAKLRAIGKDPFGVERFVSTGSAADLLHGFEEGKAVALAGRVVSHRLMGKAAFMHLSDGETRLQAYFRKEDLEPADWEAVGLLDVGDHLGVRGELFLTKTGERTIHAREVVPLSKSLAPPPIGKEKDGQTWYGLADVDQRYRHRHLDLIANPAARKMLLDRSRIVASTRRYLEGLGYLEVETPMLQLVAGGAAARPFLTRYNAYDVDVKLRISLELYLKRVVCGDVPRVFELGRVFRNEGVSNRHSPEFTMLEFYEAYANLEDMMERIEGLFRHVALEVFGSLVVEGIDWGPAWPRLDLLEAIERHGGVRAAELGELESARLAMARVGLPVEAEHNLGGIVEKLLEHFVEPHLVQPTFVTGYPIETSPLAKRDPARPGITRRFEGYVKGRELCNAFSELNDPIDQRERFEAQVAERAKGDDEAHPMDEEFLAALESGMPPTAGLGMGIERMTALLTGAEHIREITLFPMMRPESAPGAPKD